MQDLIEIYSKLPAKEKMRILLDDTIPHEIKSVLMQECKTKPLNNTQLKEAVLEQIFKNINNKQHQCSEYRYFDKSILIKNNKKQGKISNIIDRLITFLKF